MTTPFWSDGAATIWPGVVLDPFAGSGTTGEACLLEHQKCVLIEREPDYLPLIIARLTRRTDPVAHTKHAPGTEDDLLTLLGMGD